MRGKSAGGESEEGTFRRRSRGGVSRMSSLRKGKGSGVGSCLLGVGRDLKRADWRPTRTRRNSPKKGERSAPRNQREGGGGEGEVPWLTGPKQVGEREIILMGEARKN